MDPGNLTFQVEYILELEVNRLEDFDATLCYPLMLRS